MKVLELPSPPRASNVVRECATNCMKTTYQAMFESCLENGAPSADSVKFWFDFLDYMMRVIEDDKNIYTPVLNQFAQELNIGNLSAATLWNQYKMDLKMALEGIVLINLNNYLFIKKNNLWCFKNKLIYFIF